LKQVGEIRELHRPRRAAPSPPPICVDWRGATDTMTSVQGSSDNKFVLSGPTVSFAP